ncbi:MAG TPA: Hsp20/alpha crystallin family protein [Candidatus Saccharimonadales bacterium]|nr:Hsp20/alpha crystallin family protein [Candidatus Saccharimonadales bacterium]
MAKKSRDEDLLMEDELTAAFLGDDEFASEGDSNSVQAQTQHATDQSGPVATEEEWEEDDQVPGQLAVDVFETKEKLIVKARTAGVNKQDLDVSISDNTLSIRGTLSAGTEEHAENYFVQECYWGEFSRSIALPVPVKEEEIEAMLKDGVLTISFTKVKQDTVKKIQIQ